MGLLFGRPIAVGMFAGGPAVTGHTADRLGRDDLCLQHGDTRDPVMLQTLADSGENFLRLAGDRILAR